MNVFDEHELKSEIDEIAKRIDNIIKIVNQYHPADLGENPSTSTEQPVSE